MGEVMKLSINDYKPNEILRIIREYAGFTQQELANKIGKSKTTLRNYEYGKYQFTFATLCKIAKICNVTIEIKSM